MVTQARPESARPRKSHALLIEEEPPASPLFSVSVFFLRVRNIFFIYSHIIRYYSGIRRNQLCLKDCRASMRNEKGGTGMITQIGVMQIAYEAIRAHYYYCVIKMPAGKFPNTTCHATLFTSPKGFHWVVPRCQYTQNELIAEFLPIHGR